MSKRNEKQQLQENFLKIVTEYLDDSKPLNTKELEIRFGTRGIKKTTRNEFGYDNCCCLWNNIT